MWPILQHIKIFVSRLSNLTANQVTSFTRGRKRSQRLINLKNKSSSAVASFSSFVVSERFDVDLPKKNQARHQPTIGLIITTTTIIIIIIIIIIILQMQSKRQIIGQDFSPSQCEYKTNEQTTPPQFRHKTTTQMCDSELQAVNRLEVT